ncbi:PQQ-like beta-propeller repeat protein [bacterium]|nr:PQQ-like beta-propeller repeat protein [bacterium]
MRGTLLRLGSAALLATAVCWLATSGGRFVAAQPVPKVDPKKEKEKETRSKRAVASPFNFNIVRDSGPRLKAARDYLGFKEIPWNTVCPLVQNILDGPDSFYDPDEDDPRGDLGNKSWGGVQHEAEQILAKFPREGLEFYQQLYGQTAAQMLADGVKNGYDIEALKALTSRFFFTKAGAEGAVLLGSIQLERGDYADAARHFGRLMTRPSGDDYLTPRVLFRAATAFKRSPEKEHNDLFKAAADKLHAATARDGLAIGRKTYTADQLRAELERPVGSVEVTAAAGQFATHRGNAQRNAPTDAGPPFLLPAFPAVPMLAPDAAKAPGDEWVSKQLDHLFAREDAGRANKVFPLPGFFPVATTDLVLYRQYDGVRAVALRDHVAGGTHFKAGQVRWHSPVNMGLATMAAGPDSPQKDGWRSPYGDEAKDIQGTVERWWTAYRNHPAGAYLAENPLTGSLSHDGTTVYFLDDIALPPPPPTGQNPNFGGVIDQNQLNIPRRVNAAIGAGALVAADIQTGNQTWSLGRVDNLPGIPAPPGGLTEEEADKTTSAFHLCLNAVFLAPPLPLNGRLYVPVEQAGYVRLLCLDPSNLVAPPGWHMKVPALVWQVKLGRAGATLALSPARRTQGAFLAAGDGILVCPTNSGAVVGIDLMSRRILWGHVYKDGPPPPPAPKTAGPIMGGVRPVAVEALPQDRWRASAPIIVGSRVVVTGFDADTIDCLDLRTGALLWRARRQPTDLYVGGVLNDTLVVVGKESVRGYKVSGGGDGAARDKAEWDVSLGAAAPTGHGALGKAAYYLPVRLEAAAKPGAEAKAAPALEIWAVAPDGTIPSKTRARAPSDTAVRFGIGNLVFQDGLIVTQSAAEVAVYPQLEQKRAEMDRKLKANPNDPDGLLDRGDLLQDEGKLKDAVADYKAAEKNVPADPEKAEGLRRRVRERLYRAYTELLRQNFAASEGFLDEYAALCESYLEPNETDDDPAGHQAKVADRRRLYLSLLAKGRESQGRLGEAFDHYLSLAALGGDQLQPDPDEPSVLRRADVAARGRIQGMIGRASPDARKSLEGRVAKEWDAVKGGTDLARLKEFVAVFGPYFPTGNEAELLLADRLIATNDEGDARTAQLHLHRVRTGGAEPKLRARATAELAALMVKAGLLDEAVRLYLQLGNEFKDVAVKDGKTGADFLTDLLTDRRLLPYLEPARYPLPSRVRAEDKTGATGAMFSQVNEVVPNGEFLPEFQKVRFALDMSNGQWALRGFDRTTDAERYRFTDIAPFNYGGAYGQNGRAYHAGGRVLVAQVGATVYGYDLASKARTAAWRMSLTGDTSNLPLSRINQQPDEIELGFQDGTKVTIRFSGIVVRAEYAAVLGRDGLECFDPTDRNKRFWTRRYVPERTQVFGDDRHIVLVELAADRRPVGVRVIRAGDGGTVDGAPDSADVLNAARSYRIYGSTVLLHETADDGPQVVRLLDLATGKDVWKRQYDAKAVAIKSHDAGVCGVVKSTGEVDLLDPQTGRPLGTFKLDADRLADHFGRCQAAQLFADADRFYLVLDRDRNAVNARPNQFTPSNTPLRATPVNGPMYCFRRATGERAWYADSHFENQLLFLERFGDLPVLVAGQAAFVQGVGRTEFRAVVVEKERGLLRLAATGQPDGMTFQTMTVDPRNRTVEFLKPQGPRPLRIVVLPDTGK